MIKVKDVSNGSGGVITLSCSVFDSEKEFEERVKTEYEGVDPYRNPSLTRSVNEQGMLIVKIKYWGLD